jgi:hypothetical protein
LGGRGRRISEFEASLVYSEFQDSGGYKEKSCLKKKKKKKPKTKPYTHVISWSKKITRHLYKHF